MTTERQSLVLLMQISLIAVLSVLAAWGAYSVHWTRQRQRIVGRYFADKDIELSGYPAPWPIRWIDRFGCEEFPLPPTATDAELKEVQRWFPEASVVRE